MSPIPSFLSLPSEVLELVVANVEPNDLPNLRLTCKELNSTSTPQFGKTCLEHVKFILSAHSLKKLLELSEHPSLRSHVKAISFDTQRLEAYRESVSRLGRADLIIQYNKLVRNELEASKDTSGPHCKTLSLAFKNFLKHGNEPILGLFDRETGPDFDLLKHGYGETFDERYNNSLPLGERFHDPEFIGLFVMFAMRQAREDIKDASEANLYCFQMSLHHLASFPWRKPVFGMESGFPDPIMSVVRDGESKTFAGTGMSVKVEVKNNECLYASMLHVSSDNTKSGCLTFRGLKHGKYKYKPPFEGLKDYGRLGKFLSKNILEKVCFQNCLMDDTDIQKFFKCHRAMRSLALENVVVRTNSWMGAESMIDWVCQLQSHDKLKHLIMKNVDIIDQATGTKYKIEDHRWSYKIGGESLDDNIEELVQDIPNPDPDPEGESDMFPTLPDLDLDKILTGYPPGSFGDALSQAWQEIKRTGGQVDCAPWEIDAWLDARLKGRPWKSSAERLGEGR